MRLRDLARTGIVSSSFSRAAVNAASDEGQARSRVVSFRPMKLLGLLVVVAGTTTLVACGSSGSPGGGHDAMGSGGSPADGGKASGGFEWRDDRR